MIKEASGITQVHLENGGYDGRRGGEPEWKETE